MLADVADESAGAGGAVCAGAGSVLLRSAFIIDFDSSEFESLAFIFLPSPLSLGDCSSCCATRAISAESPDAPPESER